MTQTYYGINGELFDVNVTGNHFLAKLTVGLWDKFGIPRPLTKPDSLIVARLLRNYIKLQTLISSNEDYGKSIWSSHGYRQDDIEELNWLKEVAGFFERCDGLMSEDQWYDSHPEGA